MFVRQTRLAALGRGGAGGEEAAVVPGSGRSRCSRIASGRIPPGSKLPPEPELAEELGVSRPDAPRGAPLARGGRVRHPDQRRRYLRHPPAAPAEQPRRELRRDRGDPRGRRWSRARSRVPCTPRRPTTTRPRPSTCSSGDPVVAARARAYGRRPTRSCSRVDVVSRRPASQRRRAVLDAARRLAVRAARATRDAVEHGVVSVEPTRADRALATRLGVPVWGAAAVPPAGRLRTGRRAALAVARAPPGGGLRVHGGPARTGKEEHRDDERRQGDAAQAGDRSRRRVGDLRARPRDDVADVPRAARRHHAAHARGGRRRCERDHDEQGHDPRRARGVLADDVARAAALRQRDPRRRPSSDRADRRGRGGAHPRRRRGRAVHGARRRHRGRHDRHPVGGRPRVRDRSACRSSPRPSSRRRTRRSRS